MKRFRLAITVAWILLLFLPNAGAQKDEEILLKKKAQADVVPDSGSYVIGSEDALYIHVWKEETLSRTVLVRTDGKISMPLVDDIQAAGRTPLQLRDTLLKSLREYIDTPNVTVVVMEANSFRVYVSGQVKNPGVYRLRSETSLIQIIPMAGGFTDWANEKKIIIIRKEAGNEKRIVVNHKKILGDPSLNVLLKPGDTIFVP
jgi:polysaccharide export outer membrane protein